MTQTIAPTFGNFLKQVRKRAGMTQDDLAAAIGYSRSLIATLERNHRLPDLEVVIQTYLPALGLQNEPHLATQLVELAALARGERPPASLPITWERREGMTTVAEDKPHLPLPPTELLGRDEEIKHLCNRLLGHHGRLLTLVGPPGVGKTRLAQAVGAALQHLYQDGAVFVPLAALSDPALLAASLVTALKLHEGASKPPQIRLIEHLRRKEMLLILDNFEQLIPAAPLVAELLTECAGLRMLVTSRERLHLRAEQRYKVLPLDPTSAVELFAQRAAAVDTDFVLTAENRPLIAAICQRLDRLPLAIELCAAQSELFSPAQLLIELQVRPLDLLVDGAHDLPPQQRTLRRAIEHSYTLLDEEERTLFRSLGVFVGGFDRAAAEAVSGWRQATHTQQFVPTLHRLINKNLVRNKTLPNGEQRFALLETLREFALDTLAQLPDKALAQMRQRHAEYFAHFLEGANTVDSRELFRIRDVEQHNARAALRWLIDHNDVRAGVLANCMGGTYWNTEARRWLLEVISADIELVPLLRNAMLSSVSILAFQQHDFDDGLRYAHEALVISRQINSQVLIAGDLTLLSRIYIEMDDCAQARAVAFEALQISRSIQDSEETVGALVNLGEAELTLGNVEQAAVYFEEAYTLCQASDWRQHIYAGLTYKGMGEIALSRRQYEQALEFLRAGVKCTPVAILQLWILNPLAGVIGTMPDRTPTAACRAAQIWGAVEVLNEQMGTVNAPGDRRRTDALITATRSYIPPKTFDAAWAEGRELSLEDAIVLAMA